MDKMKTKKCTSCGKEQPWDMLFGYADLRCDTKTCYPLKLDEPEDKSKDTKNENK